MTSVEPARAADWFVIAGDLAREAYANEEAGVFYEPALALRADSTGDLSGLLQEVPGAGPDIEVPPTHHPSILIDGGGRWAAPYGSGHEPQDEEVVDPQE